MISNEKESFVYNQTNTLSRFFIVYSYLYLISYPRMYFVYLAVCVFSVFYDHFLPSISKGPTSAFTCLI